MNAWLAAERAFVECCQRRFPDLTDPWLHVSDDGRRLWLTDGKDGLVLAEAPMPVLDVALAALEEGR
jgi:hypothetical protein